MLRFLTAAINAPFAAVNWLFTGASGYVSAWEYEFDKAWETDGMDRKIGDVTMRLLREHGDDADTTHYVDKHGKTRQTSFGMPYSKVAAKERGEHIVP